MTSMALRPFRVFATSPAVRLGLGLSSLVVTLLLCADLVFRLLPDESGLVRQLRERISENVAVQTATLLQTGETRTLDRLYREQLAREKTMLSLAVRRSDGSIVLQAGDHASAWVAPAKGQSSIDYVRVPLIMDNQRWGDVEISFEHAQPRSLRDWVKHPSVLLVLIMAAGSFVAFVLYLRRVLVHLDPSAVIPDRVRNAFDAFSCGIMIVDTSRRVMLTNATLRSWIEPSNAGKLQGRLVETIPWFKSALPGDHSEHPWVRAMATADTMTGEHMVFLPSTGTAIRVIANCAPILDSGKKVRGCLVTLDNVNHLHELNAQLVASMSELNQAKREIEKKNEDLQQLATRDPLTGCLNRRALFEKLEVLFVEVRNQGTDLCCIMTDIDHFKSFNDRYGHAVGDQVLQATSRKLASALRDMDMLARYGGEEFCIVLPGVSLEQACVVAERLRSTVEIQAGASVRSTPGLKITSSFGVAILDSNIADPTALIDRADQALYAAKKGGRNCVRTFQQVAATTAG